MDPYDLDLRPPTEAEGPAFVRSVEASFGTVLDAAGVERALREVDLGRSLAVFDEGRVVGTCGWLPLQLTLPGGPDRALPTVDVPGVTAVGVLGSHRRRGLLRRMMTAQLGEFAGQGFAMAALTASESIIYGRFGYGQATSVRSISIETVRAAFGAGPADEGRMRTVDTDEARDLLPGLHDRVVAGRPGEIRRRPQWWTRHFEDRTEDRDGANAMLRVVHVDAAGLVDGYAAYRIREREAHGLADSELILENLHGTSPASERALWRFVLDVDLVTQVTAHRRPVDDPLVWTLADPRRVRTIGLHDHLWLRLLDVPAALEARGYLDQVTLGIEVVGPTDDPATGRYLLDAGPDGASCRRLGPAAGAGTGVPGVRLGVAELGALYLGGVQPAALAGAGRLEADDPAALIGATRAFATLRAPRCSTGF